MKRVVDFALWLVQPLFTSPHTLSDSTAAEGVWSRFLAWRLRVLVLVILTTLLTAVVDTATRRAEGPKVPIGLDLGQEDEPEPAPQSFFGDVADTLWTLSFYAMPASALLASIAWNRPHLSRKILIAGWAASFLVPVIIALMPWSWWEVDPGARHPGRFERLRDGVAWGFYYLVVLSPAVLALVPGVMRACIRVKMLLPGSELPGWLLMAAAPFNGLLALAGFVSLAQVAPSPLLLTGMLLWLAAPLTYLIYAGVYTRPIATERDLRDARRARLVSRVLILGSVGCLLVYLATWQAFGIRLIGFDAKTSFFRPWHVFRYGLDFAGRALFVNVVGADLLLGLTLSAWRQQRAFQSSPAAATFDRVMERLEETTGPGGAGRAKPSEKGVPVAPKA